MENNPTVSKMETTQKQLLIEIMNEDAKDGLYEPTQTAVEWFYQRILAKDIKEVFEQAKQMEKEQIKSAFEQGYSTGVDKVFCIDNPNLKDAEQYYNETYQQNKR